MTKQYTAAIREAYASAPSDQVILHTLSLSHTNWDEPLYLVRDFQDFTALLETAAQVTFKATAFDFTQPELTTNSVPEVTVQIDNVSGDIFPLIDAVAASKDKITLTYRPYLSNDPSSPQMDPPLSLTLSTISINAYKITAKARLSDTGRRTFPEQNYNLVDFPALANFS